MQFETPFSLAPNLEDAIERDPYIVQPTTPLVEARALLNQSHITLCSLADENSSDGSVTIVHGSCALVMQGKEIVGILTERDLVRLTAKSLDFRLATVADVMTHPVITLPVQSAEDIFAVLFLFRRYRIRHLPIVDAEGHLLGVISHENIRQVLRPANLLRLRRVSDVMTKHVLHASPSTTVSQLARLMAMHRVSCVVITQLDEDDHPQPVGIITERDIVQFQALQIDLSKTKAQMVMSSPLFLLSPEDSLWTAHQEMQKRHLGRLVVFWNWGKGLGIVTQTSLLRMFDPIEMYGVIENLQQTIQQLQASPPNRAPAQAEGSQSPQLYIEQVQASPPNQIDRHDSPASPSLPIPLTMGDRENLLSSLNRIAEAVQQLSADADPSTNQLRSQLSDIVLQLQQLQCELNR